MEMHPSNTGLSPGRNTINSENPVHQLPLTRGLLQYIDNTASNACFSPASIPIAQTTTPGETSPLLEPYGQVSVRSQLVEINPWEQHCWSVGTELTESSDAEERNRLRRRPLCRSDNYRQQQCTWVYRGNRSQRTSTKDESRDSRRFTRSSSS